MLNDTYGISIGECWSCYIYIIFSIIVVLLLFTLININTYAVGPLEPYYEITSIIHSIFFTRNIVSEEYHSMVSSKVVI